ncbi:class I SAM-dependent methyltransferase [Nesterenkonia xinjiangensis]|uniref:SAM-dependent methyltransferase n=1 Tax=Nesterenkonia xinjiangensis TaxID=225327 RepID=A0A7Z0GMR4_9MICC|nr:methyltransferase domain-containing protein [Nesterenkonia xinjiangensis]NYJ78354.1 SAM-dependent methyltransferase [Nesterenkonia xinjiangensis]
MTDVERFTRAFSTATSDFDRLGEHLWRPIGDATVTRSAPRPGEKVLDLCCGNGASAIPAARLVAPDGRVDAVDLSQALLDELEKHAHGLQNVTAVQADATSWEQQGYDLVQCVLGIFFFPDMTSGTEHVISRARPGGRVALTIWRRGAVETAGRHLQQSIAAVTGVAAEPRPPHLIDDINTPEAYQEWLLARGLMEPEVTVEERSIPMTSEIAWLVITGSGFAGMLAGLDAADVDRVREAYLTSLQTEGVERLDVSTLIGTGTVG